MNLLILIVYKDFHQKMNYMSKAKIDLVKKFMNIFMNFFLKRE